MLDIRRLRLLRELSLRGTITAVAEALAFTPSAVSQQLSVLEREAGVALLERTGRRVVLTAAGIALVGHAEAVLERLERASAELAAARTGLTGTIRIGAFPTATRAILPAAFATLAREHPGLEPMVDEIDPAEVAPRLRAGDLDVALIHEYDFVPAPPDLALDTEDLLEEPMYLASLEEPTQPGPKGSLNPGKGSTRPASVGSLAEPADPSSKKEPMGPGSQSAGDPLARRRDDPWIASTPGTLCHTMTVRACQAAGFAPRIRHHIDDFTTVLAMVAAGQGVALVPELGAADPPGGVRLTELPMRRRTRIAFRRGAGTHPAIATLIAALRSSIPVDHPESPAEAPGTASHQG
ncbi:DNA-binding transcriptional regulator, LysR family [Streptosporangium subroseum]|uniref:DNA-binding transcriptional regulator, LysR family n=1 Tax=Streptosporangium subroseum TaxID=106412 RepID=A0A239DMS0_9ACTN|nr:LysR family transcriptional regulator [Streptosporangium subroseum]SNS32954.1 DNA-binding transcriptional regulator, LysR family [Streptosporangium subroseum]